MPRLGTKPRIAIKNRLTLPLLWLIVAMLFGLSLMVWAGDNRFRSAAGWDKSAHYQSVVRTPLPGKTSYETRR
jgi:hypothetical protein